MVLSELTLALLVSGRSPFKTGEAFVEFTAEHAQVVANFGTDHVERVGLKMTLPGHYIKKMDSLVSLFNTNLTGSLP